MSSPLGCGVEIVARPQHVLSCIASADLETTQKGDPIAKLAPLESGNQGVEVLYPDVTKMTTLAGITDSMAPCAKSPITD